MPRKNHRGNEQRAGRRAAVPARGPMPAELEPPDEAAFMFSRPFNVILSSHAARQMGELGAPAERALRYLQETGREELEWSAQPMPSQHDRQVWLLGAGPVRVLFDIEDDDLTVQGFGLQPHRRSLRW